MSFRLIILRTFASLALRWPLAERGASRDLATPAAWGAALLTLNVATVFEAMLLILR